MEPIAYTQFTYSRDQIIQLVKLYQCNGKRLSAALVAALHSVFPRDAWLPVLEFLEKIAEIDRNGPKDISKSDVTRQWIALALDPMLNPDWLAVGPEGDVYFCSYPDLGKQPIKS